MTVKKGSVWVWFCCIALTGITGWRCSSPPGPSSLSVMSFNIRYDNPGDGENAWPFRKERVVETIRFHRIDVAGLQEVLYHQVALLDSLLPEYDWVGIGRDDGNREGEFAPIFFRMDRVKLVEWDVFWLSERPDMPGSLGWDAACSRVVTWARFEDRNTRKPFCVFNTHFDHVGRLARKESAVLLLRSVHALARKDPAVVTGDFNCLDSDTAYALITHGWTGVPGLRDTRRMALYPAYGSSYTFNGFKTEIHPGERIDYIFVHRIRDVFRHGVLSDRWDGRFVSDHHAVIAEMVLPD